MAHAKLDQSNEYPIELSLSKLHRVLRPLRSRSIALANLLNSPSALLSSPGRRPGDWRTPPVPAASLLPSNSLWKPSGCPTRYPRVRSSSVLASTSLDDHGLLAAVTFPEHTHASRLVSAIHRGVSDASLSRKITAVRDAFRAAVKVAYPNKPQSSSIVPSLSQMCAAVLGASIEPTVVALITVDDGDSLDDEELEEGPEETEIVDKCYEDIPEHLRRWAIIPHAIGIIHRALPGSILSLWENLLTICIEDCSRDDVNIVTIYALNTVLNHSSSNIHSLDTVAHEKYLVGLYHKVSSTPRYHWSEADFVNLLLKTMNSGTAEEVWSAVGLNYLFQHISDPFARLKLFDAIIASFQGSPQNSLQIQHWCSQIIETDLTLPPDDAFEDAPAWIDALRSTAICFLDVFELTATADLLPAVVCFATHVLARCDGSRVTSLIDKMGRVSGSLTRFDKLSHFRPLLLILDDSYFFEAVRDYVQVLRQAGPLFKLEALFLAEVVAHVEAHSEPTDEDPDPEPLLDDIELETVSNWLAEAEDRVTRLQRPNEHGSRVGTPRKQPTMVARPSPRKTQSNNRKRRAEPASLLFHAQSPPLRPAKRTRTTSRAKSPPVEIPASSSPSSPFQGIAHRHLKENRTVAVHSPYTTPPKPRPLPFSKEFKPERPVTPSPQRSSRTAILAGHSRALKHHNVQEMEDDSSDSEKTASSEPDPLDLLAISSPPRGRHPRRR